MFEKFIESYKPLIIIPVIITIIAFIILSFNGLNEGVDLKGGSIIVIDVNSPTNQAQLENSIKEKLNLDDVTVISLNGNKATVELNSEKEFNEVSSKLSSIGKIDSFRSIGPSLSKEALNQVYFAVIFAFLFMAISVFIVFREPIPSLAVVLSALSDIIISLSLMSIFNIPLSIASVGAILMLIGYSVDTDILLTTRLLKRKKGTVTERAINAIKTGLTMSITAIAAMVVLLLVTTFIIPEARTLTEIASVLLFGLVADIIVTWLMNLGILRWYVEVKQ